MSAGLAERQAFIGVGTMGSLMAGCLLDAGVELTVFDIRPEAAESLIERGASWADSAETAATGSTMVWTSLMSLDGSRMPALLVGSRCWTRRSAAAHPP